MSDVTCEIFRNRRLRRRFARQKERSDCKAISIPKPYYQKKACCPGVKTRCDVAPQSGPKLTQYLRRENALIERRIRRCRCDDIFTALVAEPLSSKLQSAFQASVAFVNNLSGCRLCINRWALASTLAPTKVCSEIYQMERAPVGNEWAVQSILYSSCAGNPLFPPFISVTGTAGVITALNTGGGITPFTFNEARTSGLPLVGASVPPLPAIVDSTCPPAGSPLAVSTPNGTDLMFTIGANPPALVEDIKQYLEATVPGGVVSLSGKLTDTLFFYVQFGGGPPPTEVDLNSFSSAQIWSCDPDKPCMSYYQI